MERFHLQYKIKYCLFLISTIKYNIGFCLCSVEMKTIRKHMRGGTNDALNYVIDAPIVVNNRDDVVGLFVDNYQYLTDLLRRNDEVTFKKFLDDYRPSVGWRKIVRPLHDDIKTLWEIVISNNSCNCIYLLIDEHLYNIDLICDVIIYFNRNVLNFYYDIDIIKGLNCTFQSFYTKGIDLSYALIYKTVIDDEINENELIKLWDSLKNNQMYNNINEQLEQVIRELSFYDNDDYNNKLKELQKIFPYSSSNYNKNGLNRLKLDTSKLKHLTVFDVISLENIDLYEYLQQDSDNIVFIVQNKNDVNSSIVLGFTKTELNNQIAKGKNRYYGCKKQGYPFIRNVNLIEPYFILRGEIVVYVMEKELEKALLSNTNRIFILTPMKVINNTTNEDQIIVSSDEEGQLLNRKGKTISFVSKDHCQPDTLKQIYSINEPISSTIGGKTRHRRQNRRSIRRIKSKSKKRFNSKSNVKKYNIKKSKK